MLKWTSNIFPLSVMEMYWNLWQEGQYSSSGKLMAKKIWTEIRKCYILKRIISNFINSTWNKIWTKAVIYFLLKCRIFFIIHLPQIQTHIFYFRVQAKIHYLTTDYQFYAFRLWDPISSLNRNILREKQESVRIVTYSCLS